MNKIQAKGRIGEMKFVGLLAGVALIFGSFGAYAAESHMKEALKHAEAAPSPPTQRLSRTC